MKVQVIKYTHPGDYYWDYNNSRIGARGLEGTIECGYLEGDTWQRREYPLDTRITEVGEMHYLYVVIDLQHFPENYYVALVQHITSGIVAFTPIHIPGEDTRWQEWKTTYHQVEE